MNALGLLLVLAPLLATVATVVAWRLKTQALARIARITFWVGVALLGLGFAGVAAGAIHCVAALDAPGLSQADGQRILSNGVAEGIYNAVFALIIGVPPTVAGGLLGRARRSRET
jgi:hypothetical protein